MGEVLNKLAVTLGKMLRTRGMESRLSEYRILGLWERAVGTGIAQHARPRSLVRKKLTLIVDSPAWMQQLSLLRPQLIEKVNSALGHEVVREIMLKLGEIEVPRADGEEPSAPVRLDDDDRANIERSVRQISDVEIREAVRRVMEKDRLHRKRKTSPN